MPENNDPTSLTVVIPAYNEAESLPKLLPSLLEYCKPRGWKVIVVNDGSRDRTREVLLDYKDVPNFKALHHKVNRGYGGALKTGLAAVDTEFAVTFDADGQHAMEDIDRVLAFLLENNADMVVGLRPSTSNADWYRSLGKFFIRRITRILLPVKIKDLNSGFKLYRVGVAQKYLPLCPRSMAFSDIITLVLISEGNLVLEHPIEIRQRQGGKSTISTRTAVETVLEIIHIVMMFNPMRIFLPVSFSFIVFGLLWEIPILLMGRGVSVGSMLLIVIGIISLFLGLVSEQLSHIQRELLPDRKPQRDR
jgi:glycosyltransferase involved in cell wall biosynthesis